MQISFKSIILHVFSLSIWQYKQFYHTRNVHKMGKKRTWQKFNTPIDLDKRQWNVCMWRWQYMNRLSIFFDTIECWCFQWSETYLFIHRSLVLQMTIWFIKCIVSFSSHARCCHLLGMEEHSALQQLNISSFCSVFINTDFFVFCVNLCSVKLKSLKNLNCCLKFHLLS